MSVTAVEFEGVSKRYHGGGAYPALREDLARAARRLRGGDTGGPRGTQALEDVSFAIREGESVGLIGPNGAGKTTALKLISRISRPTGGTVRVRGRVGALLEVGAGMHPELTGRENVGLYGRILGLSRSDIRARFDDIVGFAELERFIDQPVKNYSSGMQLRLGFSIASHLEPDVLLADEAIAVGDVGFQYRCVARMRELVEEGRTLVFVSHEMSAVETLCDRALLVEEGRLVADGPSAEVVRRHLTDMERARLERVAAEPVAGEGIEITRVTLRDASGGEIERALSGEGVTVRIHFRTDRPIRAPIFSIGLLDGRVGLVAVATMLVEADAPPVIEGDGHVDCVLDQVPLHPRTYEIWGSIRGEAGYGDIVEWQRLGLLPVGERELASGKAAASSTLDDAPVRLSYTWRVGSPGPD